MTELARAAGAPGRRDSQADTELGEDRAMEPATIVQLPTAEPETVRVVGDRLVVAEPELDLSHKAPP